MPKHFHAPRAGMLPRVFVWALTLAAPSVALLHATCAWADPPAEAVAISIPAGDLDAALQTLAKQTGADIVFRPELVKGLKTSGVSGQLTAPEALGALLKGTALSVRAEGGGSMIIVPESPSTSGAGVHAFNIPPGELGAALKAFSDQAHLTVKYAERLVRGKSTQGLSGNYAPADALRVLLSGTGLTATTANASIYVLKALPKAKTAEVGPSAEGAEHVLVAGARVAAYEPGGNVDLPRTIDDVQPYYIIDSETLEQSGAVNLEDFLKQHLTMNAQSSTNSQNISSGGPLDTRSTINLRGLGAGHTLILVDGRRWPGVSINGDGGNTQPDINGIPLAAIDHIEVLPSSASGIYGGSAVGGVINIILKRNYNGGDISISYGKPESSTASSRSIDGNYGFSLEGGKTHIMLTADYSDESPLTTVDRGALIERGLSAYTSKCPNGSCLPGISAGSPFPAGSDVNLLAYNFSTQQPENLVLANGTVLPFSTAHITPGCIATQSLVSCLKPGVDYSLAPGDGPFGLDQQLGAFDRVSSLGGTFSREMTTWLTGFATIRLDENVSESNHIVENQSDAYVNGPYFKNQYVLLSIPSELVPGSQDQSYSSTRAATVGLTARLPGNWHIEADYSWSKNVYDAQYSTLDGLKSIIDMGGQGIENANTTFAYSDTPDFPLLLPPPGATAKWLQPSSSDNSSTVNDLALRGTGPVGHLPWGDPTLAFGLDVERDAIPEAIQYQNPTSETPAQLQGFYNAAGCPSCYSSYNFGARFPTTYFSQTQTAASLYAEANIPLVTDRNAIPGVQALALQVTDRLEHYTVFTGTSSEFIDDAAAPPIITYSPTPANADSNGTGGTPTRTETTYRSNNTTLGLKWDPIRDVMIRGSVASAFLPPQYFQLLTNPQVCVGCAYIPTTGTFVNETNGGNPNLKPETSRSVDAGVIYEPRGGMLQGLRVDLEHYRIEQFNAIVSPAVTDILSNPGLSSRVTRNAQGQITLINLTDINAPQYKTQGNDLSIAYHAPIYTGVLDVRLAGTMIQFEDRQLCVSCQLLNFAGWTDEGGEDKYKANGSVQYSWHGWRAGWTTTWYGRTNVNASPGDPYGTIMGPGSTSYYQGSYYIPAQSYSDLLVGYAWDSHARAWLANTKLQLVVTDVLNQVPPLDVVNAPFFYSTLGDIRLRTFQLLFKKSF